MRRLRFCFAFIASIGIFHEAFAADPTPPAKPPTIEDLQKQVTYWQTMAQALAQQRDQLAAKLANAQAAEATNEALAPKPPAAPRGSETH